MKKYGLIFTLISLFTITNISNASIIPLEKGVFTKKVIDYGDNKHHFFMYLGEKNGLKDLFIVFHGGKTGAEGFMKNTGIHNSIIKNNDDLVVFDSYKSANWYKNKNDNINIVNYVLRDVYRKGFYNKIYMIGYAEGGTFMTDIYCQGRFGANEIWNVNGTINKSCDISNNVEYNIIKGEKMLLMDYSNEYYRDYIELKNYFLNRTGGCKIYPEKIIIGNKFKDFYVLVDRKHCPSLNNYSIYTMKGVGRNFPASIKSDVNGFEGETFSDIDIYNWVKNY